jgi:selenide, water dikinase
MLDSTTQLNRPGAALGGMAGVHALTDVTGFGLLGHLLEVCRGSGVAASVVFDQLPLMKSAVALAQEGFFTGASTRNWDGYGAAVRLPEGFADWKKNLLTDPQTSGGLLVACEPAAVPDVLRLFADGGFAQARQIGSLAAGQPGVAVR